jgi:hypothetical protein
MRRGAVCYTLVGGGLLAACSTAGGGNEPWPTSAGLDVSGESNAPCTLTLSADGKDESFEIAAPIPALSDAPSDVRAPLGACDVGDAATVNVTGAPPQCVRASRTATQLCFVQDGCLGSPATSQTSCPVALTLTCNGVKLYDHVPWHVCQWLG